jgi:hypothetical protein
MANSDQDQSNRHEPQSMDDTENDSNPGKRKQQEKRQPKSQRKESMNCKSAKRQDSQAQKSAALDLELPQHQHEEPKLA